MGNTARGKWFKDNYGITGLGMFTIIAGIVAIIALTVGILYATGVFRGNPFTCPKGQHAYVETWIYVPMSTGKTTLIVPIPVMACSENGR